MKPKSKSCRPRRRIATPAQRRAANIRERRRMFNLNTAFDRLRKKVPTFAYEKRLSRIETLRLSIMYISFMTDLLHETGANETSSSTSSSSSTASSTTSVEAVLNNGNNRLSSSSSLLDTTNGSMTYSLFHAYNHHHHHHNHHNHHHGVTPSMASHAASTPHADGGHDLNTANGSMSYSLFHAYNHHPHHHGVGSTMASLTPTTSAAAATTTTIQQTCESVNSMHGLSGRVNHNYDHNHNSMVSATCTPSHFYQARHQSHKYA